jgi:DNA polymerase elongation subunit (family B)
MKFYTNVYSTGSQVHCRGIDNNGKFKESSKFDSCVYIPSNVKSSLKTITGNYVKPVCFSSLFDLREFKETYNNVDGFEIHGDIQMEYQYISKNYGAECEYDFSKIKVMYLDIETTCENGFPEIANPIEKVIAVTFMIDNNKTVFCLGKYQSSDKFVKVNSYDDEKEMLYDVIKFFNSEEPDIISGWNIRFFDMPYLINRIISLGDELNHEKLSPWEIVKQKEVSRNGKDHVVYDIIGVSTLDYYELYKTFTYSNQESYKLDYIAWIELGERKISYKEYDNISDFYKNDFQKFIEYNIKDVELVKKLEDKLKLMELAVALAYSAGVNFNDVFSQVRTWDVIIYNHLLKKNIVIPPKKSNNKNEQYAGAYVKEPLVGMHKWVVSYDISSMYPSTIMQFNISPETLVNKTVEKIYSKDIINPCDQTKNTLLNCKENDFCVTANGTLYTKTKHGFLPELMDKMYKDRKTYKDKMIESKKKVEAINLELKKRGLK